MIVIFWAEQFSVVRSSSCKSRMLLSGFIRHLCWVHSQPWQAEMSPGIVKGRLWVVAKSWPVTENQTSFTIALSAFKWKTAFVCILCVCIRMCEIHTKHVLPCKFYATRSWRLWLCSQHSTLQWSMGSIGCLRAQPQDCAQDFSELWPMVKISR